MPLSGLGGTGRLNSRSVRDHNLALVLHELERRGCASRSLICSATGLTPGAVTLLVNELMEAGLIEVAKLMEAEGGRRKKQLRLSSAAPPVAAIELATDEVRIACETFSGERIAYEVYERDFRKKDPGEFAAFAAGLINDLSHRLEQEGRLPLAAVGISTITSVLVNRGDVLANTEFGWPMMDFGALMREALAPYGIDVPVVMLKSADCAGWAEYRALAASEGVVPRGILFLTSDATIGGSFIFGDRIYNGPLGTAMGIGHIQMNPEGEVCACGKRGCLTLYASAPAIIEQSGLAPCTRQRDLDAAVDEVRRLWLAGVEPAHSAVARGIRYTRVAIENALTLLVADCVILGGYMAAYLDDILAVENGFTSLGVPGVTSIRAARLGQGAALTGALMRLRGAVIDHAGELMRGERLEAATLLQDTL